MVETNKKDVKEKMLLNQKVEYIFLMVSGQPID